MSVIKLENISNQYRLGLVGTNTLRKLNIEIEQSEVPCIIGKNSAGKSNLLKVHSRVTSTTAWQINLQ